MLASESDSCLHLVNTDMHAPVLKRTLGDRTRQTNRGRGGEKSWGEAQGRRGGRGPDQFLSAVVPGAVQVVTMGAESDSSSPSKLHDPAPPFGSAPVRTETHALTALTCSN